MVKLSLRSYRDASVVKRIVCSFRELGLIPRTDLELYNHILTTVPDDPVLLWPSTGMRQPDGAHAGRKHIQAK